MEWVDELPGKPPQPRRREYKPRGETQDLRDHAAQLVAHPLRWAVYPRNISSPTMGRKVINYLRDGLLAPYSPALGFEAVLRRGKIYVRHNPDRLSETKVAFHEGYRAGVRDTLEKARAAVWDFRMSLAKIEEEMDRAATTTP